MRSYSTALFFFLTLTVLTALAAESVAGEGSPRIQSVFGSIGLKIFDLPFDDVTPSGPMEVLGPQSFLFVTACGKVIFTSIADDKLTVGATASLDELTKSRGLEPVYCDNGAGVKGTLVLKGKLYVSHHIFDYRDNKAYLVVREFTLHAGELKFTREVLRTTPGVNEPFIGFQSGGRMASDGTALLIALGDFSKPRLTRVPGSLLGKVLRINLANLSYEVVSRGLRSPTGGLFYDAETNLLWETEHGPRGGDEINLIKRGKDYGWPVVSYGTSYERDGMGDYYGNAYNTHTGYEKPKYVFMPDIGIGMLAKYPSTGPVEYWHGDYFLSGMANSTLYRVRIEGEHVVYAEPVLQGFRIREVVIHQGGAIYLKTDDGRLLISDQKTTQKAEGRDAVPSSRLVDPSGQSPRVVIPGKATRTKFKNEPSRSQSRQQAGPRRAIRKKRLRNVKPNDVQASTN
jgi:aldose sugar dehydrogenase